MPPEMTIDQSVENKEFGQEVWSTEIVGSAESVQESRKGLRSFLEGIAGLNPDRVFMAQLIHDEIVNNEMMHGYKMGRENWPADGINHKVHMRVEIDRSQGFPVLKMTIEALGTVQAQEDLTAYFDISQPTFEKVGEQPSGSLVEQPGSTASHFVLTPHTRAMEGNMKPSGRGTSLVASQAKTMEVVLFSPNDITTYPTRQTNQPVNHEVVFSMSLLGDAQSSEEADEALAAQFDMSQFDLGDLEGNKTQTE